jgi:hypothetical protein
VSLLFEDIPRPPGSLLETVISSYRHSVDLHLNLPLQSTVTGNSQKLMSLITSTPLSVVKFEFFEDLSSIISTDEVLYYLLPGGSTF